MMIVSMLLFLNIAVGCDTKTATTALSIKARPGTDSPGYLFWQRHNTGFRCLKSAEGELNGDEKPDLLVIYQDEANDCFLVAVIDTGKEFKVTMPFSAPVSEQVIDIFDMDGKSPYEFSVSGRKGTNIGSAVFRLENGQIVQLFSSGYGDCC
jgi:hypothetical protein